MLVYGQEGTEDILLLLIPSHECKDKIFYIHVCVCVYAYAYILMRYMYMYVGIWARCHGTLSQRQWPRALDLKS